MEPVDLAEVNAAVDQCDAERVNAVLKKLSRELKEDRLGSDRNRDVVECVCSNLVKLEQKRLDEAVRSVPSMLSDVQSCQVHLVRAVVSAVAVAKIVRTWKMETGD